MLATAAGLGSHKSRSEVGEEVWYHANDEVQPYSNTSTGTTTLTSDSMKLKGSASLKEIASSANKQKPTTEGQARPTLITSQHESPKSVSQPQESADSTAQVQTSRQMAKCPIDRLITQKLYGGKQASFEQGKMEGYNSGSSVCK